MMPGIFSLLLFFATTSTEVVVITLPVKGAISFNLAPTGNVEVERIGTVSRVRIAIDRPQPPQATDPRMNTFVVWALASEGEFENIGELGFSDKIRFEATTRFDQLAILITAEPHHMVDRPSSFVAYRNQAPRSPDIRRVSVPVQIG